MYELETSMRTGNGPSFLPKTKPPRIGSLEWVESGPGKPAVFNSAYDIDGSSQHLDSGEPWTVITADGEWEYFPTQPEALAYALTGEKK